MRMAILAVRKKKIAPAKRLSRKIEVQRVFTPTQMARRISDSGKPPAPAYFNAFHSLSISVENILKMFSRNCRNSPKIR
jgi:hypothetical protein